MEKYKLKNVTKSDFGAVVAAACLAHDIGNPPFGHSGEEAISNYFKYGNGKAFRKRINNPDKWDDLINFEGNANGFRLLTNSKSSTGGGIKLTFTTLAAFSKYPCKSRKPKNDPFKIRASQHKYGYFYSEAGNFDTICKTLGIRKLRKGSWCRHPLAFLVEAADDICYRIIDFEDGVRIGLIDFKEAEEILFAIADKTVNRSKYDSIKENREKIGYLRSKVIHKLIYQTAAVFWTNEKTILSGDYDKQLTKEIKSFPQLKQIESLSIHKVYKSRSVLQIEIAGFSVVAELLDLFIVAVNDFHKHGSELKKFRPLSANLINLLPDQFLGDGRKAEKDLYLRILQICEFVAGMTDSYAMTLFKRLKGIQLPHE